MAISPASIAPTAAAGATHAPSAAIPLRTALYLRISKDTLRRGLGVARQERDCRDLAARKGWPVAEVYVDNDTSASRKGGRLPERPDFRRLLEDIEAGRIQAVVAWDLDRLVRDPLEHEQFLLRCERAGMHRLVTLADEVNIENGDGLMVAGIKAQVAAEEVRKMSKRVKRKLLEVAEAGRPAGGVRKFGYRYERTWQDEEGNVHGSGALLVDEAEAAVVREAARRVLAGQSLGAYARELNEAEEGPRPVRGGQWRQTGLRQTLMGPAIAGLRVHQGVVLGDAAWEPILDRATWEAVTAILTAPERMPSGNRKAHLLSGLVRCGSCGYPMGGNAGGKRGNARYTCNPNQGGCGRTGISAARLEELVVAAVFRATSDAELGGAMEAEESGGERRAELLAALEGSERKLKELAGLWATDELTKAEWLEARRAVEARRDEARAELAALERLEARKLEPYVGAGRLEAAWPALTMEERRVVLKEALEAVRIAPIGTYGGRAFHPGRIELVWQDEELSAELRPLEPVAPPPPGECSICGDELRREKGARGSRCGKCETYHRRHGVERPTGMGKGKWARGG